MPELFIGGVAFASVLFLANEVLKKRYGFSYAQNMWLFTGLYLTASILLIYGVSSIGSYLTPSWLTMVFVATLCLYIVAEYYWGTRVDVARVYGYTTIPEHYRQIVHLTHTSAVSKISEICFQQVCALLLVVGLLKLGISEMWIYGIFTVLVFIFHLPTPRWFGVVYGNYFKWMATLLAPVEVYLLLTVPSGFYLAVSLHMLMYLVLYLVVYVYGER